MATPEDIAKLNEIAKKPNMWDELRKLKPEELRRFRSHLSQQNEGRVIQAMAATEGTIRHAMSRGFWGSAEDASKWLAHRTGGSASDAVQRVHRLQAWVKANPRTALAVGGFVGIKLIPWSDEMVLIALTVGFLGLMRAYAMPVISESLNEMKQAIKTEVLSGKPRLNAMKEVMDTHIRAANELAKVVAAPRPLTWAPPKRSSFALLDFTRRFVAVQRDAYASVKQPASWSWFARMGNEVPLPK